MFDSNPSKHSTPMDIFSICLLKVIGLDDWGSATLHRLVQWGCSFLVARRCELVQDVDNGGYPLCYFGRVALLALRSNLDGVVYLRWDIGGG